MAEKAQKNILIFGAAKFAQLATNIATYDLNYKVHAFIVDSGFRTEENLDGIPVIEWMQAIELYPKHEFEMFMAVGHKNMRRRAEIYQRIKHQGYTLCNLISPASYLAKNVRIGDNTIIAPGVVIEPEVMLGCNNVIWSNTTISHDTVVGDHNFIAANATIGGHVNIGNLNFLSASTTIEHHIRIGNETLIGAQSYLRSDTQDLHRYWGVPAQAQGAIDTSLGIEID